MLVSLSDFFIASAWTFEPIKQCCTQRLLPRTRRPEADPKFLVVRGFFCSALIAAAVQAPGVVYHAEFFCLATSGCLEMNMRASFVLLGFATATPAALAFSTPLASRAAGVAHSPSTRTTPGWRRGGGCSSSRWAIREGRHLRSFEGGDFPSDVGGDAGSSAVPAVLSDDNPDLRETMKREILSIAATSNRCGYPIQRRCCLL